ncbi:MAG: hypothetical protein JWO97_943 [Acidobacteria bacterium]|nr:hypothetical protein [Acidobacteriota bacterium]
MIEAARLAAEMNPANQPHSAIVARALGGPPTHRASIAAVIAKKWPSTGVRLSVKFMDKPETALRKKILSHMNAWGKTANVVFTETNGTGQVRIARLDTQADGGFWSYVGVEILVIPPGEPTLNLEGFTINTIDSEFNRVVRHEAGHTLGFPHEHMRRELVDRIDEKKAIAFFGKTQGWSPQEVKEQVLTPIEESALLHTSNADPKSIMCYQIPGSITKSGKPILGGTDIDDIDASFAASIYPKAVAKKTATMKIPKRSAGFA